MNLSDLLRENKARQIKPDLQQAQECLTAAKRDIKTAKKLLSEDCDWAFSVAYNAMLQSTRALMFAEGYAAKGDEPHKTAVEYAEVKLGAKLPNETRLFEQMRKKRHISVYEKAGSISEYEAKSAIETAEKFFSEIEKRLKVQFL
ncbi:hypothetical protein AUJ17_05520 [Candidatus Micrarchaeota archaeon CG1_02_47_40]|nr:MAG: hypothetical protein AUJ17_05520 [Candidatus Micrarchaeota archaeon CG1_02_47_40]